MTPRDLDRDVVLARLVHLDELMQILTGMHRPALTDDPVSRLATERILSQSVENDLAIVEEAAAEAPRLMDDFGRSIARWLESRG